MLLYGKYFHSIDEKSRLILPLKLRKELGNEICYTRGLDGCIAIYPIKEYEKIIERYEDLDYLEDNNRNYLRSFYGDTVFPEIDKQGRILITKDHILRLGLDKKKDVIVLGVRDHIEVWEQDRYLALESINSKSYEDNARTIARNAKESEKGISRND